MEDADWIWRQVVICLWALVPDIWCGRLKSMQTKICFLLGGEKEAMNWMNGDVWLAYNGGAWKQGSLEIVNVMTCMWLWQFWSFFWNEQGASAGYIEERSSMSCRVYRSDINSTTFIQLFSQQNCTISLVYLLYQSVNTHYNLLKPNISQTTAIFIFIFSGHFWRDRLFLGMWNCQVSSGRYHWMPIIISIYLFPSEFLAFVPRSNRFFLN